MDTEKLLDTAGAAALLGIGKSRLDHDRNGGDLRVPFVRIGALVRYDPQALLAWARARMVNPPPPVGTQPEPQAQAPEPPRRRGRPRKAV